MLAANKPHLCPEADNEEKRMYELRNYLMNGANSTES